MHGPRDFNIAPGANALFMEGAILANARGERFMQKWDPRRIERAPRVIVTRAMALETLEGRGPVYLDATHLDSSSHRRLEMALPILMRTFAIADLDLRKDRIPYEVCLVTWGPGGIKVDKESGTTIPGLYAAGAASDHAEDGVSNVIGHGMESAIGGYRAGIAASQYIAETNEPTVNDNQIKAIKQRMFAPLKRDRGLTYQEVWEHCITIFEKGLLGPIRSEKGLKEALNAVQEIRELEIPRLIARDYHELAKNIGLENAMVFPELLARCSLLRSESRGSHYREEYPERDDRNWLKWVIAKRSDDGANVWAVPVPFHEYPLRPEGGQI